MKPGLERLLHPKSIAVIGGGAWCENVIQQSRAFGFSGPIWPVHPNKPTMAGEAAYPSITALPGVPDACFIGINRHATIDAVAALSALGAGGAVCFASGFLEAHAQDSHAADLQQQLLNAAQDMPILGPNCYGFINYLDGALLWPDQHGGVKTDRGVAIVTQSSNIAINITMQRRGLPIAYMLTAGNQAQTGLADIGAALLADPRVTALGLHIEGVGDIGALETLAEKARTLGKPIIALKVGQSQQAQTATISHTASLAGSDAGARALLARLGIAQIDTLSQFTEALKLLHICGPLSSNRIASMSCSGGEASLIADLAQNSGVTFPPLNDTQQTNLRATLGPMVKLDNPLDYHTYIWGDPAAMADTFAAMVTPDIALGIVVSDFPRSDRCTSADWDCVIDATHRAQQRTGRPMAVASSLPENMPEDIAARLISLGITPLCGLPEALIAVRVATKCAPDNQTPAPTLKPHVPTNITPLSEADAKAALAPHGLPIPNARFAQNAAQLPALCGALKFPLVLKGQGIAHKTEAGAVALNLTSPDQVETAAATMPTKTFLLEEMVTGAVTEMIIGVVLDPAHGYVLTLGAGGTLAELIDDKTSLLLPVTAPDITAALAGLKTHKLLCGFRGKPGADIPAIIDAALALQSYVTQEHGRIQEVEINPLICLPDGAIAADALIQIGETDD